MGRPSRSWPCSWAAPTAVLESSGDAVTPPIRVLDVVALLIDAPEHGLVRGQVGTVVEQLGDHTFEVEFNDDTGSTYGQVAVAAQSLLPLRFRHVGTQIDGS